MLVCQQNWNECFMLAGYFLIQNRFMVLVRMRLVTLPLSFVGLCLFLCFNSEICVSHSLVRPDEELRFSDNLSHNSFWLSTPARARLCMRDYTDVNKHRMYICLNECVFAIALNYTTSWSCASSVTVRTFKCHNQGSHMHSLCAKLRQKVAFGDQGALHNRHKNIQNICNLSSW